MRPKLINTSVKGNSIGILLLLIHLICLGACSPTHSSYSDFVEIAETGWARGESFEFIPHYGDSLAAYDVKVAFCYGHNYPFRNMCLVVDYMHGDSLLDRRYEDFVVADEYGNKKNAGFGVAYQAERIIDTHVSVGKFDKIRIWHGIDCDTLRGITQVGVTIMPMEP